MLRTIENAAGEIVPEAGENRLLFRGKDGHATITFEEDCQVSSLN
ncbi:hypothetical protein [Geobacter argillaceus]|uniref:Uncharacterized protein n=1 Tax=Geobacter argillaceus TaxID=345631 RepID=A0A562VPN7_9BACT|nr:hypothetical protein [Geobacter argillaceus]TWJ19818.1 hypothetical protein JN12_01304 [Geobacter argillaceus]